MFKKSMDKETADLNYLPESGFEFLSIMADGIGAILVSKKGPIMLYTIGKLTYQGVRKTMLT